MMNLMTNVNDDSIADKYCEMISIIPRAQFMRYNVFKDDSKILLDVTRESVNAFCNELFRSHKIASTFHHLRNHGYTITEIFDEAGYETARAARRQGLVKIEIDFMTALFDKYNLQGCRCRAERFFEICVKRKISYQEIESLFQDFAEFIRGD